MRFIQTVFVLSLFSILILSACGGNPQPNLTSTPTAAVVSQVATPKAQVITPSPTPPQATPTMTPVPIPTATSTPVPTASPEPSPTATPRPVVQVNTASGSRVNVRTGPGTDYPIVGHVEPGQTAAVTGRNIDASWWQITLEVTAGQGTPGWVFSELVTLFGNDTQIPLITAIPPPPNTPTPEPAAQSEPLVSPTSPSNSSDSDDNQPLSPEALADKLRCGRDFCVTYQALLSIGENGGCVGNHSIYITVLEGLPPGKPMDGVVIGDTYNNVEVGSGSHGPGRTEITLWNNSMTLIAKRHQNGTPYSSEESFNFTAHDELIPADVLAAAGYCEGSVAKCREAQQHNQVCRGHYSWRVTFHKFD